MGHHIYDLGTSVKSKAAYSDPDTGSSIDPDTVELSIRSPASITLSYTYNSDVIIQTNADGSQTILSGGAGFVTRDGVGKYRANINANVAGTWYYRWWSTGNGQAAQENRFEVRPAQAI